MKAHTKELAGLQHNMCFLFCSHDNQIAALLGAALGELGLVTQEVPAQEKLAQRLAEIAPILRKPWHAWRPRSHAWRWVLSASLKVPLQHCELA